MNKKIFNSLFVFLMLAVTKNSLCSSSWDIYSIDKNIFVGSILFPKTIKSLPQIPIYRRGLKIKTETETSNNKIQFTIAEDRLCNKFYLLIANSIMPDIEENTVKYLTVDTKQDYKFYELNVFTNRELTTNPISKLEEVKETYFWNIQKRKLNSDGILPDDTLIIMFNPKYVDKLEGGSTLELPKIIIKKNILQLAGSEKMLTDETNERLLSSLDLNIIHTPPSCEIKPEYKKKLIVAMANPD